MWVKAITTVAVFGLGGASVALADHDDHGYGYRGGPQRAYGRVVAVDPVVRYVTVDRPQEQCWDEVVRKPAAPFGVTGQTIAGGVIGAAIGRQFGGGSGRDLATALGAVAGSMVANERAQRNLAYADTRDVTVQRCEVVRNPVTEQVIDGYDVAYVYQGRRYTTRTATRPGERIELAVDVRPAGYRVLR